MPRKQTGRKDGDGAPLASKLPLGDQEAGLCSTMDAATPTFRQDSGVDLEHLEERQCGSAKIHR